MVILHQVRCHQGRVGKFHFCDLTYHVPRPPPPLEQDRWGTSGIDAFPSQLGWIIWILRLDKIWTSPLALRKYPKFVLNNRLDVDFSFCFLTLQGHNATSLLVPVHIHKKLRARCIGSYPKPLLACLPFRCWICMETYKYVQYMYVCILHLVVCTSIVGRVAAVLQW